LEVRDGKELEGIEAEITDIWEAILEVDKGGSGAGIANAVVAAREGADVELIDEEVFEEWRGERGAAVGE
jgi:hypothetical protein